MAKEEIITNGGETEFQLRLNRDEGIGLITTKTGEHYLLLDSADYWYDVIQDSYPRAKKCSCKNEWFTLQIKYYYREHYDDVKHIEVLSTCTKCAKTLIALDMDIKYSPTDCLVDSPLVYCKNPKIKYKTREMNGYWTETEFLSIVQYCHKLEFFIYCWYFDKQTNKRMFKTVSIEELAKKDSFLHIYLSQNELDISEIIETTNELGIYLKENLWRKNELIDLNSLNMNGNELYFIHYATQFIDNSGEVQDKSKQFNAKVTQLEQYLKENFINKRGKNCFDGELGYAKYLKNNNMQDHLDKLIDEIS